MAKKAPKNYRATDFSNRLIHRTYKTLPLTNRKLLMYLISLINPKTKSLTVKFNLGRFTKAIGIPLTQVSFTKIITALEDTIDKSFFLKEANGGYALWHWWSGVDTEPVKDDDDIDMTFIITFNKQLRPYLLRATKRLSHVSFQDIMLMKNIYSPKLYILIKNDMNQSKHTSKVYSVLELHQDLNLFKTDAKYNIKRDKHGSIEYLYPQFSGFNKRVLTPASAEINRFTKYDVNIKPISANKFHKIADVKITMTKKTPRELAERAKLIERATGQES